MSLLETVAEATKTAMKARDKARVGVLRLVTSELKRTEIDSGKALDEAGALAVLTKMVKQRKDSHSQYESAGRADLAEQEAYEIEVIGAFMPEQLDDAAIQAAVAEAIAATGATGMADMGKVMGALKGKLAGKADMGAVSAAVKARLG